MATWSLGASNAGTPWKCQGPLESVKERRTWEQR